jgi:hypothetical protein
MTAARSAVCRPEMTVVRCRAVGGVGWEVDR